MPIGHKAMLMVGFVRQENDSAVGGGLAFEVVLTPPFAVRLREDGAPTFHPEGFHLILGGGMGKFCGE